MTRSIRLDLRVLLPEVEDHRDECVSRLISLLENRDGVERVHVVQPVGDQNAGDCEGDDCAAGQLCLHYDPSRLQLSTITERAHLAGAEIADRYGHATLPFHLVGSEDDGARLERGLRELDGVTSASVNLAAQVARVEFDRTRVTLDAIARTLGDLGASARPAPGATLAQAPGLSVAAAEPPPTGWLGRNRELVWSLLAGALLLAGWLLERQRGGGAVPIAIFLTSYFFGARDNVGHFIADLRRGRFHFNIDLLMVVAAAGAAALGAWSEGALLLFLFSLGHALEHYALGRARNAIKALGQLTPQEAVRLRGGVEERVSTSALALGDLVVVKPAERLPVDGVVRDGQSSVNQAPITGESVPVEKVAGTQVFAGSVNGEGALVIEVTQVVGDRTLDRVIKLVQEAQTQKAPTQQFTERFERIFVPIVLVADGLLIVAPPLLGVWTWSESFYRAMTLLVAASPCALALGTPAAILSGIAQAARNGVLIKGGAHLENLGAIDVLALDKTGTITKGEPAVVAVRAFDGGSDDALIRTAAAVEGRSQHPLAQAIIREAAKRSLELPQAGNLESLTGFGIRSSIGDTRVDVGRLSMFDGEAVPEAIRNSVAELERNGRTTVVVRTRAGATSAWPGVIGIADEARADARVTLDRLRALGVKRIVMLTGDNPGVGAAMGREVGIDDVRAGLLPEDKVTSIKELAAKGKVGMVGDGVNDAPALAHATVGIAMGGAGTAAALETADVALMGDELSRLPFVIGLSRQTRAVIRQNLALSLGVIAVLVVTSVFGWVRIGMAVVVHEGSTLVVIANALRLLGYRDRGRAGSAPGR